VDDIRLDTKERPDTTWYNPAEIRDPQTVPGMIIPQPLVSMYPNPFAAGIIINGNQPVNAVKIYTPAGQLIKELRLANGTILYLAQDPTIKNGVYLLEVNNSRQFKKIVLVK
jgi:hypothetical protein